MSKSRAAMVLSLTVLLSTVVATPVVGRGPAGEATGRITWEGENGDRPGRTSIFRVHDGSPGDASSKGDRGWYRFSEYNDSYHQRMRMRITCVRVQPPWAEFAGVITHATGNFQTGNVFVVSVLDTDVSEPGGYHIGMKSFDDLDAACDEALDGVERGRKGIYTGGFVEVRARR